jgi:hypothetical protein
MLWSIFSKWNFMVGVWCYWNRVYVMKFVLLFLLVGTTCAAHANYRCVGKVAHLGIDGNLNVSNGFGVHRLCAIAEEKCKAWTSLVMAAKMADRPIVIYYDSDTVGGDQSKGACLQIGDWVRPSDAPYYVQLQ